MDIRTPSAGWLCLAYVFLMRAKLNLARILAIADTLAVANWAAGNACKEGKDNDYVLQH
jgi:hypothetical protein